mgnify:FL=1
MGRNTKHGLEYFPMDIDIFSDLKIRKLIKRQGGKAITVYALLLCNIYKEGYYIQWDEELPFFCSELTGFDEAYISEVIKTCLSLGLFSKTLFESRHVLTSKGIQTRYQRICQQSRRKCQVTDNRLIPTPPPQTATTTQTAASPPLNTSDPLAPTPTHADTLDKEILLLKQDEVWLDNLQCLHGLTVPQLRLRLDDFRAECMASGKVCHESIADAKHHFHSWLRLTHNITTYATDKQKHQAKRTGNPLSADAAQTKNYGSSF